MKPNQYKPWICPKCDEKNPDSSRSLIAFVQKHELRAHPPLFEREACWKVFDSQAIEIAKAKTWTAAVRKAKQIIEKGRK